MKKTIYIDCPVNQAFQIIVNAAIQEMKAKGIRGLSLNTLAGTSYPLKMTGRNGTTYQTVLTVTDVKENQLYAYQLKNENEGDTHYISYHFASKNEGTSLTYVEETKQPNGLKKANIVLMQLFYRSRFKAKLKRMKQFIESQVQPENPLKTE